MRRVAQIEVVPESQGAKAILLALCEDGTIWATYASGSVKWAKLPPIPDTQETEHGTHPA